MKKIIFCSLILGAALMTSCSNDEIENASLSDVQVQVSLSKFFDQYEFYDTRHGIYTTEDLSVFNIEDDKYIQVRAMFYNAVTNQLEDSIVKYVTNTNDVLLQKRIAAGTYKVVTTLCFADEENAEYAWWFVYDRSSLTTAKMHQRFHSQYSILSVSENSVTVADNNSNVFRTTPNPVGVLVYYFFQNFQYKDETTYGEGKEADNKVRRILVATQQQATDYKLDSQALSRYDYYKTEGSHTWRLLVDSEPTDYNSSWKYFKTNLYGFTYVLAPECDICFGYVIEGESIFHQCGGASYNLKSGNVYLAYFDWFQVGNPYFGLADNNHWNSYDDDVKAACVKEIAW